MQIASELTPSSLDRLRSLPFWLRYGSALAAVLVSTWVSLRLTGPFYTPEWFLAPAVLIVITWYCGKGPGWVALLASVVAANYFFVPPIRSFQIGWHDIPFFLSFILCEVLAGWAVNVRARTERRLREANEALAAKERAEKGLGEANLEVARLMRISALAEMAAAIAHEVNQPLAAIVANADACEAWLKASPPGLDEALSAAGRAVSSATRATEVIGRIRGMMTKTEATKKLVDLNGLVRAAMELISYRCAGTTVAFRTTLREIPKTRLDEVQIQQVILNLLSNAVDATGNLSRNPRIDIRTNFDEKNLKVEVSDNGHGASVPDVEQLFKPFYTTRTQGVGVGLSISRSFAEAHGGRLWAEENPDYGLTFHLSVPRES